jgi:hypothetical protein
MPVLKDRLMTIYVPKEGVAIGENVMKCWGHLSLFRFQSIQSARFLIKFYVLSESNPTVL